MLPEQVDHPEHYGGAGNPYEAIKVIEAWALGFCLGNTVKYIARAGKKTDALTDLKKARWYLDREITALEQRAATSVCGRCPSCGRVNPGPEHRAYEPALCADAPAANEEQHHGR